MSLNYDLTKTDTEFTLAEENNSITESVIFRCMNLGIGVIDDASIAEFYARGQWVETRFGGLALTPEILTHYIGLKTNVFNSGWTERQDCSMESRRSWLKRVVLWEEEAKIRAFRNEFEALQLKRPASSRVALTESMPLGDSPRQFI